MTLASEKLDPPRKRRAIGTRHFIETYATSIMLHGCAMVQGVILARALGTEGRGNFAAIILWPTIIANAGMLGTNMAVMRASAAAERGVGPIARTGMLLSIILSAITVVVGLLLLPLLIPEADSNVLSLARIYMVLFVPACMLSANLTAVDQGQGNFRRLNFFRLLRSPVYVLLLVVLILLARVNLMYCICASIMAFWVTALGRLILLMRENPILGPRAPLLSLFRQGIPYAIVAIVGQFTHRGDRILLLWLMTDRDLGLYVVAFSAASVLANLPKSMGFVSLTIAAQEKPREGFARIAQIFRGAVFISFVVGIFLAVVVYLLLPLVYGKEFADARITAIILSVGIILLGLSTILSQCLKGQGKPQAGMFSHLAGLVVMVIVASVLSGPLGVNGVALGFVASRAVNLFGIIVLTVHHYNSASLKDLVPTIKDAKLVSRRLKQQAVAALTKFGIIRSAVPRNASTLEDKPE